jgi:hypothetical protein
MGAKRKFREIQNKDLDDSQWAMAGKVREILSVCVLRGLNLQALISYIWLQFPHSVQQLMSGETTPVLSGVLPAFQRLQNCWESHATKHRDVSPYIYEGMTWLNKYHEKAGRSPTYVIAMGMLLILLASHKSLTDKLYFVQFSIPQSNLASSIKTGLL